MPQSPSLRVIALALLCLAAAGCATHDASDPSYGAMFKQTTQERVNGNQFWDSAHQKDCVASGTMEVCTPPGQNGI